VASHPPLLGRLSLKLRKGTKLLLRQFCLGLFRYRSVRSAAPAPLQKSWIRDCVQELQLLNLGIHSEIDFKHTLIIKTSPESKVKQMASRCELDVNQM